MRGSEKLSLNTLNQVTRCLPHDKAYDKESVYRVSQKVARLRCEIT